MCPYCLLIPKIFQTVDPVAPDSGIGLDDDIRRPVKQDVTFRGPFEDRSEFAYQRTQGAKNVVGYLARSHSTVVRLSLFCRSIVWKTSCGREELRTPLGYYRAKPTSGCRDIGHGLGSVMGPVENYADIG